MSIKSKQVAAVTTLVVVIVAVLSVYHVATLARMRLKDTAERGRIISETVFQRAREIVPPPGVAMTTALGEDAGLRSILSSGMGFGSNVTSAAIVDPDGVIIAHGFQQRDGERLEEAEDINDLLEQGPIEQLRAIYSDERTFETRQALLSGDAEFGSIRIGISPLLIRGELSEYFRTAAWSVVAALIISSFFAVLFSNWMLRPIHVIQSGLTRLGRGELDVSLDLPGEEFRDLGSSFEAVSAQLSAVRGKPLPPAGTDLESVMENLEDAVALFSPSGEAIFTNAAMKALLAEHRDHPAMKSLIDQTLAGRKDCGPVPLAVDAPAGSDAPERLLMTHAIEDSTGRFVGAMVVARNIGYLSQVHSTLNYSRKLSALNRLMAGVAHEVKNPLNAMTIHLELLKRKLGPNANVEKHVNVIDNEIHRLDAVLMGFLKFARPDELKLQPVKMTALVSDVVTTVRPEAERANINLKVDCPTTLPEINADPGMLRQAILNLALNACQAMPAGGTLRIACRASQRKVEIDVEDTGVGIPPENLSRIFDLYFTTKEKGSGIGLSMVYRIIQLHDGEVEVQSTPGSGTRFRLVFPQVCVRQNRARREAMTTIRAAALAAIVALAGAACTTTRAATPVDRPALEVPPPPPRVVTPLPTSPPQLEPVQELGPGLPAVAKPRPQRETSSQKPDPKAEETKPVDPPPVAPPVQQPAPQLRLPENSDSPQAGQIQEAINRARAILNKVDYERLPAAARKAYNESKIFADQAAEELKNNNLAIAKTFADKAERLAKELQGR